MSRQDARSQHRGGVPPCWWGGLALAAAAAFGTGRAWRGEGLTATGQRQCAPASGLLEGVQEQPPEAPTEDLRRQEEVGAARDPPGRVGRQAPSRQDTMEMRVMVELLAPRMEDGEAPDLCAEMLRVSGNILERLCDGPKE